MRYKAVDIYGEIYEFDILKRVYMKSRNELIDSCVNEYNSLFVRCCLLENKMDKVRKNTKEYKYYLGQLKAYSECLYKIGIWSNQETKSIK